MKTMIIFFAIWAPLLMAFEDPTPQRMERIAQDPKLEAARLELEDQQHAVCPLPKDRRAYWWHCLNPIHCRYGVTIKCFSSNNSDEVVYKVLAMGKDDTHTATFSEFVVLPLN